MFKLNKTVSRRGRGGGGENNRLTDKRKINNKNVKMTFFKIKISRAV